MRRIWKRKGKSDKDIVLEMKVLDILREKGEANALEIADELNTNPKKVLDIMKKLKEDGILEG